MPGTAAAGKSASVAEAGGTARVEHAALPHSRHRLQAAPLQQVRAHGEAVP